MPAAVVGDDVEAARREPLNHAHAAAPIVGDAVEVDDRAAPLPDGGTVPAPQRDLISLELAILAARRNAGPQRLARRIQKPPRGNRRRHDQCGGNQQCGDDRADEASSHLSIPEKQPRQDQRDDGKGRDQGQPDEERDEIRHVAPAHVIDIDPGDAGGD